MELILCFIIGIISGYNLKKIIKLFLSFIDFTLIKTKINHILSNIDCFIKNFEVNLKNNMEILAIYKNGIKFGCYKENYYVQMNQNKKWKLIPINNYKELKPEIKSILPESTFKLREAAIYCNKIKNLNI